MNQSNEIWKPVPVEPFQDAYEVSSHGRVRSLSRTVQRKDGKPLRMKGRLLATNPNDRGYPRVTLSKNGHSEWFAVHSLVALAFLPKPPRAISSFRDGFVVNHKDGDKLNNHVSNLEYIASTANIYHARATGKLSAKGVRNNKAKLTDDDIRDIREAYSVGATQVSLADDYGVDQTTISRIVRWDAWKHVA